MTKSGLLVLPDECTCIILSFLRPSEAECVALTFNRRLFTIAAPHFAPFTKIRKDEAYFESLYGKISNIPMIDEGCLEGLYFTGPATSVPSRPSHRFEYLDLRDDLSWFEEVAKEDDFEDEFGNGCVYNLDDDGEELEKLIRTTSHLGLTHPLSFIKLLRSDKLLEEWSTGCAWFIDLSPTAKIRKAFEDNSTRHEDDYIFI